jgi:DNA-binding NarL/FixJ family response regulator
MARTTALADIDPEKVSLFRLVLKRAKAPTLIVTARVDVVALRAVSPDLLICDLDALETDPLEALRQLSFVLPRCVIVIYTLNAKRSWGLNCHTAGANGVLSKDSNEIELAAGLKLAMADGCFTDPRLRAVDLAASRR